MARAPTFLTARWCDLALLDFAVDPAAIAGLVPSGTELDAHLGLPGERLRRDGSSGRPRVSAHPGYRRMIREHLSSVCLLHAMDATRLEGEDIMPHVQRITPCLWFDRQAEEAVAFYTTVFKDSRIVEVSRYGEAGREVHGQRPGTVMTVAFELAGQAFTALNGGPAFTFNEAVSFQVNCETQEEVDDYWTRLSEGGDERAQQCGWLKDRYGVSWQIVPRALIEMIKDPDPAKSGRVMEAMLRMKKIDIATLERAYAGQPS